MAGSRPPASRCSRRRSPLFRSPFKLKIPLNEITAVKADAGALIVRFGKESAVFHLGPQAEKWAKAILEPRGSWQIGIKPGQRVMVIGLDTPGSPPRSSSAATLVKRGLKELDHLFLAVSATVDLERIPSLKAALKPKGTLVLRPKGPQGLKESDTREAGRAAGLVDVKVVGFSASHSAEKFVIPLSER